MGIYRRGTTWWVDIIAPDGKRIRRSAGTENKRQAQEYHDRIKAEAWRVKKLRERPAYTWKDAVMQWVKESHKTTLDDDLMHIDKLDKHLGCVQLIDIDRNLVERITQDRIKDGVSNATVNRMLEVLRAILNRAQKHWEWIDRAPAIRMLPEPKRRVRWITREEADRLIDELPAHLKEMVRFSLATGLRESNVTGLEWSQVDLVNRRAWIHADQAKAKRAIPVPLNADAMVVLRRQQGKHERYVFTYRGEPVTRANNHAWRNALRRAGIKDFRWHDLRHTWASWHVQAGTPLHVLQELGGWSDISMVMRYAHLGAEHLAEYADAVARPRIVEDRRAVK